MLAVECCAPDGHLYGLMRAAAPPPIKPASMPHRLRPFPDVAVSE